MKMKSGESGD